MDTTNDLLLNGYKEYKYLPPFILISIIFITLWFLVTTDHYGRWRAQILFYLVLNREKQMI